MRTDLSANTGRCADLLMTTHAHVCWVAVQPGTRRDLQQLHDRMHPKMSQVF